MSGDAPAATPAATPGRRMPVWAKVLLVVSVLLMAAGMALPMLITGEPAPQSASAPGAAASGFAPTTESPDTAQQPPAANAAADWSPLIFRLGFSFFVGFAVAFALRAFLKFAIVALGFFFILLFGLQYAGLIEVKWALMEQKYNTLSGQLTEETKKGASVLATYLPSASSALVGMVAGFWRRSPV